MRVVLAIGDRLKPQIGSAGHTVASIGLGLHQAGLEASVLTREQRLFPPPGPATSLRDFARADVVHNFGMWTPFNYAVSLAAQLCRAHLVLTPMGMLEPWALAQRATGKRLALLLYQRRDLERAAAIQATSAAEVENVRALGIEAPIALIPHGVDIPAELPPRDETPSASGARTMLFLSRLHPKKGLLDLVDAWARLRPAGWRMVVAGPDEGGHRAEVEAAVHRVGLEGTFTFTGAVSPHVKAELLRNADVFVLPTYSENFGLVVPEALGYGTPVLTTRGTPWSELVDTASGWWIEPGAAALTSTLETIFSMSQSELQAMGARGRKLVLERYSWSAIIKQHIELYRWVEGSTPKPSFIRG